MKESENLLDEEEFEEAEGEEVITIQRTIYGEDPNLSPEELEIASEHSLFLVRRAVALNPNTPILIIIKLTQDENEDVSNAAKAVIIAQASNISQEELERLSAYPIAEIRQAVVVNSNTAIEVVTKLTQDEDVQVANAAKKVIELRKSED